MSKIYAVLASTSTIEPAGQSYGSTTVTLTDGAGAVQNAVAASITLPDGSVAVGAVFDVSTPGGGSVVAQAVDTSGNPMGAPVSGSFTIPSSFPLPTSLTVTVA